MATIYIARKDIFEIGEHSYFVFDPDGNPDSGDERIIRGGTSRTEGRFSGQYLIEVDRPIAQSRDSLSDGKSSPSQPDADPYNNRYYTTVISGDLQDIQTVWDDMAEKARSLGEEVDDPWAGDDNITVPSNTKAYILPENTYYIFSPNCNTLTGTVGAAGGIDVINNLPKIGGDPGSGERVSKSQYIGVDSTFGSTGNDTVALDPDKKAVFDQGGADVYTYDPTANPDFEGTFDILEDANAGTLDKIALQNVDSNDVEFIRMPNGDLYVFLDGQYNPLFKIVDQFDDGVPKINALWVYPPGGGSPVVLPLNNPDIFPLFGPPHDVPAWIPGVSSPYSDGEGEISPIVLDVDGSGTIELAALNGAGSVYWEGTDGDDFREASGWIAGGDGLLCVPGANGIVDGQSELFGNDATYSNGY